ncbi:DNA-binding transcriptional LysR family regulator [Crossiella equi]|uniref:DNA-binding transcriptional LysR family regulator n=1 Tax=Crossiella equi TaxID=130796 RepID=A0ABS5AQE9_9PSEU|nr:LysR substrate-binding domain-containing protein [Crossiella equi]MBP2478793.1 DNA-binding transcriptional LysR family regulator [Crossiella equi]
MNLVRHLRYFLAVADELHFGRAAARLHMAQPPLSQRIQRLEKELGVRLFDRSARSVALTEGGRLLLPEARELVERADRLHALAGQVARGEVGTLRAGILPDLGGTTIAAVYTAFRRRCPEVTLELHEITTAEQIRELAGRRLDAGILRHPFDVHSGLAMGPVLTRALDVVLPGGHPLAAREEVAVHELRGGLVLFPRADAPALHDELLTACARHGFTPTEVHAASNPEFAAGLVLTGAAVALAADTRHPGLVRRPLRGRPLLVRTCAVWPADRASTATAAFADAVTEVLGATAPPEVPRPPALHPRPVSEFWL